MHILHGIERIPMQGFAVNRTFENRAYNILALSELDGILAQFKAGNVPVLLLKGAALLNLLHRESLSRPMCDIDLLVHKQDLRKASSLMSGLGYSPINHNWGSHVTYGKADNAHVPVEIHWNLFNRKHPLQRYALGIKTGDMWDNPEPVKIGAETGYTLAPENQIIYLSCHMLKESFSDSKWMEDMNRIVRFYAHRINWEDLVAKVQKYRVAIPVWFALVYVNSYCGTKIPETVLKVLQRNNRTRYTETIMTRLFKEPPISRWQLLPLYFKAIEIPSHRIKALLELCPYLLLRNLMMKRSLEWSKRFDKR
jgi:hypothetical protein